MNWAMVFLILGFAMTFRAAGAAMAGGESLEVFGWIGIIMVALSIGAMV
jgi:hypothetical protein